MANGARFTRVARRNAIRRACKARIDAQYGVGQAGEMGGSAGRYGSRVRGVGSVWEAGVPRARAARLPSVQKESAGMRRP